MAQPKTLTVRITETCKYCPANGEPEILEPGDVREMLPDDGYNIVSSGRGVVTTEKFDGA